MPARSRPSVDLPAPDGDSLPRREVEVDAVEDVSVRDVRVAHVPGSQVIALGLVVGCRPVRRHPRDPHEARERGRADLDLVQPRDQSVDGVSELHDVERDRGHLADGGVPVGDEPAAPGERRRHREHVGELRSREPDRAEPERPPLGPVRILEVGVDPVDALLPQSERVDRPTTLDRLPHAPGERRVRRALPEIRVRRALQVPARADPQSGDTDDARQRRDRVDPERRADGQDGRHRRNQCLGNGEADRPGQRVDVGRRTGDEVAGPGPFDRRERQAEHAAHEVLPKLGEDLLRDHERGSPCEPGQHRLREEEHSEDQHDLVDVRPGRPVLDGLHEPSQ
jgi:hypothetical protein